MPVRIVDLQLMADSPTAFYISDGRHAYWFPKSQARYRDAEEGQHLCWYVVVTCNEALAAKSAFSLNRDLSRNPIASEWRPIEQQLCLHAPRDRGHGFRGIVIARSTPS
jgi:hypothetical protein